MGPPLRMGSDATGNITSEYIFFGGKRVARRVVSSGQVQYYFADHLGSSRVVTDATGAILDDADFYPFGGERTYTSTSGNAYKFTGKERDTESGLDDFGARYFTSQFGRFMTPDWSASPVLIPYGDLGNPQTFNLYAYVANNPLNGVDPDGHFVFMNGCNLDTSCADREEAKAQDAKANEQKAEQQNQQQQQQPQGQDPSKPKTETKQQEFVIVPDLQTDSGPGKLMREQDVYFEVYPIEKKDNIASSHPDSDHKVELKEKVLSGSVTACVNPGSCVEKAPLVDTMRVLANAPHSVEKRFTIDGKSAKVYDQKTKKTFDYIRVDASTEKGFDLTYRNNP